MGDANSFTDAVKLMLTDLLGLGRDGSHVQLGMMLFVAGAMATRGRGIAWTWTALLALEMVNEWIDWGYPATTLAGTIKDVVTTMLGPSLLWLAMTATRSAPPDTNGSGEDGQQSFE